MGEGRGGAHDGGTATPSCSLSPTSALHYTSLHCMLSHLTCPLLNHGCPVELFILRSRPLFGSCCILKSVFLRKTFEVTKTIWLKSDCFQGLSGIQFSWVPLKDLLTKRPHFFNNGEIMKKSVVIYPLVKTLWKGCVQMWYWEREPGQIMLQCPSEPHLCKTATQWI